MLSAKGILQSAAHWPVRRPPQSMRDSTRKPGGAFSSLHYRNYRLFWFGQLISVTGTFMQGTAQQWLVLSLSKDPLALGIVGALQFGPLLLLAPISGAIADRLPRRNLLMGTQAAAGLLATALWLLTVTHLVALWHVFVLAFLLGIVNAVDMPTRQSFISELAPGKSLLNAISLNSAQFNVSRIAGPGLAGLMIWLFGEPLLFLLNALSFVAVIGGLFLMRPSELIHSPQGQSAQRHTGLRALGDGARFILATPSLRVTILLVAVLGTFGFNFNVLLPLQARTVLHADSITFGLISSALGCGALIGALFLARRQGMPTKRLLLTTAGLFGAFEALLAVTDAHRLELLFTSLGLPWLASHIATLNMTLVSIALIAATGLVMSTFSASANTRTQLSSPPELRGRVMGVYMMLFVGTTPIGNLLVSGVAARWGVSAAWLVSGVPCLLIAIVATIVLRSGDARARRSVALEGAHQQIALEEMDMRAAERELAD